MSFVDNIFLFMWYKGEHRHRQLIMYEEHLVLFKACVILLKKNKVYTYKI